ncbi:hypothetical protein SLEP1_g14836 [Rubroshorea leprosula]|uniref:CTLH domain-containing protein n=1 Tax=Rubroshorea leprosula TaxID=152421 RepID=A0AAV5IVX0_9ROSI|nr:hypothetical protein SLEP1_g14836 [Rubroshorea leprosula]
MILDKVTYRKLIILLLHFLDEENYKESLHSLERESKIFFNMKYFGELVMNGEWEKAEKYLSGFTKPEENNCSRELFLQLRKQKFVEEALRDVNAFQEVQDQSAQLSPLDDTRVNGETCGVVNTAPARAKLLENLKTLVEQDPELLEKLGIPSLCKSAFWKLIKLICPTPQRKLRKLKEELGFLIIQFLDEEKFHETAHELEQESRVFFNMDYFWKLLISGEWDKVEKYLSAFNLGDDECLARIFSVMKCQTRFEALDRANLFQSVKMVLEKNPFLRNKLKFPDVHKARLMTIIKQTMDWWVPYCANANWNISFENIPTVPKLCHIQLPVTSAEHDGVLPEPSGLGSRGTTCCTDVKPTNVSVVWELAEISEPTQCCALVLPDDSLEEKNVRLVYSYSGDFILAWAEDATYKLWIWRSGHILYRKVSANLQSQLYHPSSGMTMINEIGRLPQDPCFALESLGLFSAFGGRISTFCWDMFEKLATFADPSPSSTYFTFLDQNTSAIGFNDSSILIHCLSSKKNKVKLQGHEGEITCLVFSHKLNVLVSSGADAQLCVWTANGWQKLVSKFLQRLDAREAPEPSVVNHMEFHLDHIQLLLVQERQIGIYEAPLLHPLKQWVPIESDIPITFATYSCNCQTIYVSCKTGCIKVLVSKTLTIRCRINVTAYAQCAACVQVYPLSIAAHPSRPNQIAVRLSNGSVHVLEPLEYGEWGVQPPTLEDGMY